MRLLLRVADRLRELLPDEMPLFVRISATDWAEGGWDIEQSVVLARALHELGVDLIDVSSGGLVPKARIPVGKGYQVPFARRIRDEAGIRTGAVGLITEPDQADEIVTCGRRRPRLPRPRAAPPALLGPRRPAGPPRGTELAPPVRICHQAKGQMTRA